MLVCACVWFVSICLRMPLVNYCVTLYGLFVVFACCFVWACVFCNNRVHVCVIRLECIVWWCVVCVRVCCLCACVW